jgi:hypothetical protein
MRLVITLPNIVSFFTTFYKSHFMVCRGCTPASLLTVSSSLLPCYYHHDNGSNHSFAHCVFIKLLGRVSEKLLTQRLLKFLPRFPFVFFYYNKARVWDPRLHRPLRTAYDDTRTCSSTDCGGAGYYYDCGRHIIARSPNLPLLRLIAALLTLWFLAHLFFCCSYIH